MSTPTEPTTPQPKPADAAGLLSCPLCNSASERTPSFDLHRCCNRFCKLGQGHLLFTREEWLQLTAPTPHAAEAGVRAGDGDAIKDAAKEIHGLIFNGSGKREDWQYLKAKDIATNIEGHLAARHRPAAETVGTGELSLKALWAKFHTMWGDARAGRTYCKADWMEMQAMVNKLTATPPATQSALEQAREAVDVALWAEWNGEAAAHAEGRPRLLQRLEIYRTALAALNAVLTPAKGGDGK